MELIKTKGRKLAVRNNGGFTLTELLVALVIGGILLSAVSVVFSSQQKSYVLQDQVAGMQQNLRAAMQLMEREIRMAGYDPLGTSSAGIQVADANTIRFTMDIHDGAGSDDDSEAGLFANGSTNDVNEDVTYSLLANGNLLKVDAALAALGQPPQLIAENIDALDFVYFDANGVADPTDPNDIRSVLITIVARTGRGDRGYVDTQTYQNQLGDAILAPPNDAFRRRVLTSEVLCRNLWF
jgi:type IV pilus assembly protein PilW